MAKKNYFVVWVGRQRGIFDSWGECEQQVKGYSGAKFKGFRDREDAEIAFQHPYTDYLPADKKPAPRLVNSQRAANGEITHWRDLPKFPRSR